MDCGGVIAAFVFAVLVRTVLFRCHSMLCPYIFDCMFATMNTKIDNLLYCSNIHTLSASYLPAIEILRKRREKV